jgi:uncharacterized membrane protein YraQ (UPF0718 family)
MKNLLIKTSGNLKLFILVIAIYLIFAVVNTQLILDSLNTFISLVISILPILVIVFLLMFISNLFLSSKRITKLLGSESGIKGYIFSVIFGILSAGPIYMWYPLLSDLKDKGVKNSLIVVFLYNRAVKIPLLPMMIYYFGSLFVLILTIYMIIFSIINGLIIDKLLLTQKR